jgi:hypothetical protein
MLPLASRGKPPESPPPSQTSLPVGRWSVKFANGVKEVCEVQKDRTASVVEPQRTSTGEVAVKNGSVVIIYQDDRVERWTLVGQRMVVEHWFPSARFPSGTPVLGIGEAEGGKTVLKGLQMSIGLEREQYRADEPVILEVIIKNTLDEEADLGMSASDLSSFAFVVRYVDGGMSQARRMPLTKFGATLLQDRDSAKNVPIRLKGGEQRPYRFPLNRMVDMTLSGTYSVAINRYVPGQPRYDGEGRPLPPGPKKPDELVSNELSVGIKEPPTPSR